MQIIIDLSNNTKYPNIDEFFGFAPWTLVYIHLQFWISFPASLIGNSIVIYTSLKFHSLNMDRISCALLENLAAADLVLVIVGGCSIYSTVLAKRWVLGKVGCIITFYLTLIGGGCEIFTLATISLYRAVLLKNPFFFRGMSQSKIRVGLVCLWLAGSIFPLICFFLESIIYYEPKEMSCTSSAYAMAGLDWYYLVVGLLFVLPMLVILASNTVMLIVSIRYRRRMARMSSSDAADTSNMTAVLTVTCVCWLFMISWLPWIIVILCESYYGVDLPIWFSIFQQHLLGFNVVFNPVIYTLTNKSFKAVLKKKVYGPILSAVSRSEAETSL